MSRRLSRSSFGDTSLLVSQRQASFRYVPHGHQEVSVVAGEIQNYPCVPCVELLGWDLFFGKDLF